MSELDVASLFLTAFTMGFFGGVHCLGMCGGIVGLLSGSAPASKKRFSLPPYFILVNLGRLTTYSLLGLTAGALGHLAQWQFGALAANTLRLLASLFLIALGLYLMRQWMGLTRLEKFGAMLWQKISPYSQKLLPIKNKTAALTFGMLWGFLPCGLVYSALIWTLSSQSGALGAAIMLCFGLGTLPSLIATGMAATHLLRFTKKPIISYCLGILVIFLGLISLYKSLSLSWTDLYAAYCHVAV